MFKNMVEFLDIYVFAFILMILASWQLSSASFLEGLVALIALISGLGLLYTKRWGLIGAYVALIGGMVVYFGNIWYEPIVYESGAYVITSILKLAIVILLFWYIGRERVERRFADSHGVVQPHAQPHHG